MKENFYKAITNFLGWLCILLGLLVVIGWYRRSYFIVQLDVRFLPMQFNTAICFILSGISLILLNKNKINLSRVITLIIFSLSGATLCEYFFNINLGLDELFIKSFVSIIHKYPGRMPPSAALGFIFSSVSLFLLTFNKSGYWIWANLISIFLTLSLGFLGILSYFLDFSAHFGAGDWVRMAIHTAIGLIVISLGHLAFIKSKREHYLFPFLPLLVTFTILNLTFLGWQMIIKNQEDYLNKLLNVKIDNVSNIVALYMKDRVTVFSRITYRWMNRGTTPKKEWQSDAMHHIEDEPGYVAIEWVDSNYRIHWIAPEKKYEYLKGVNLNQDTKHRIAIMKSIALKGLYLSAQMDLIQGGKGILLFSPIFNQNKFSGIMIGIMNAQILLENIIKKTDINEYGLIVDDGAATLYNNSMLDKQFYTNWNKTKKLSLYGQTWNITLWPSSALYNEVMSSVAPTLSLIISFIVAILSGFLVHTIVLVKRGISKLNKTRIELANAHERLQGIVEGTSDLVAAIDLEHNFIAFNTMYKNEIYRLFKINLHIGMNFDVLLKRMNAENRKKVLALWTKALRGSTFTIIESFKDKFFQDLNYEIRYSPIRNIHGDLIGACHIATNVHKRIKNEIMLAESKKELELMVKSLEKQNKELALLKELTSLLQSSLTLNDAVDIIASYIKRILLGTSGIIYLISDDPDVINPARRWGEPASKALHFVTSDCLALLRHQIYYVADIKEDVICNHVKLHKNKPNSYVCLPLYAQEVNLGLLYVELREENQRLMALAQIMSEQISLSIYNIKLRDDLKTQSIHDSLTGLYNRRFFEEYVDKEILIAKRNRFTFAILILDIDFFKKINDTYGHMMGDKVLSAVALNLRNNCRESDVLSRWGGEEFVIFLKDTSLEDTKIKAEDIRSSIENMVIELNDITLKAITVSIGISFFPYDGEKIEGLISKADEALYLAKNTGRNKVETTSAIIKTFPT